MRACPQCLSVYETDPEFCSFDGHRLDSFRDGDPLIGKTLGDLRIEARLGTGGTGVVYRATQLATELPCAVKLLFGEMATDKQMAERFDREAEAAAQIRHPNIVRIIDHVRQASGVTYLVMDYIEGRTLKELVDDEAPLPAERVASMAMQLASGLAAAHKKGYVHRDLKPGNVMVSSSVPETLRILDFGIVASLQAADSKERLTKTGFIVGTPTYMAPEQIDPRSVSPQIDVYALGVILYELLTGEPPFVGTLEQILVAKMTQLPEPLPESAGELGPIVLELLATSPADRPATALHVCSALSQSSLTADNPATVLSETPDLMPLGQVGFQNGTLRFADDTDSDDSALTYDPAVSRTVPDTEGSNDRDTDETDEPEESEERWRADTRLTPAADARLPSFTDNNPTSATPRRTSIPQLTAASLDEATIDQASWEHEDAEELPTRVAEVPRPRSASEASARELSFKVGDSKMFENSRDETSIEYDHLDKPLLASSEDADGLDLVADTYVRPAFPSDDLPALREASTAGPTLLSGEPVTPTASAPPPRGSIAEDTPFDAPTAEVFAPTVSPSSSVPDAHVEPAESEKPRLGLMLGLVIVALIGVVATAAYLAFGSAETVIVDVPNGVGRVVE